MYRFYSRYSRRHHPEQGDCPEQRDYVFKCRQIYHNKHLPTFFERQEDYSILPWKKRWKKLDELRYNPRDKDSIYHPTATWLYDWGYRVEQCLHISYEEFCYWIVLRPEYGYKCDFRHSIRKYGPGGYRDQPYRYRNNHKTTKKVISGEERQKREWKASKRTRRSKYSRSCPKWMKRYCNKTHRQMERECINTGQYDRLYNTIPKDIFDPWMWN